VARRRALQHVEIDTNYWKSFVHGRLGTAMGDAGSEEAVAQLRRIARSRPDLDWLSWHVQKAEARAAAAAWTSLQPASVIGLPAQARRASACKAAICAFLILLVVVVLFHLVLPAVAGTALAVLSEVLTLLGMPAALYLIWPKVSGG